MTLDYDNFAFKEGVTPLNAETFNFRFFSVVRRLHALEQLRITWEQVVSETTSYGLARINEAVKPLVDGLAADMQTLLDEGQAVIDAVGEHADRRDNPHGTTAALVPFDNAASGIVRTDLQGALDEIVAMLRTGLDNLGADIAAMRVYMPGEMKMWPAATPPDGWFERDGSTLDPTVYPELYAVIGTTYGGDGVTTFALPDDRGLFKRAWDHGRGYDPGREFGSEQDHDFASHAHNYRQVKSATPIKWDGGSSSGYTFDDSGVTSYTGGSETRPRNRAYLPIIKY